MAKTPTPKKAAPSTNGPATAGNRRERMASFEAARKKDQRRRTVLLFVICGVLALGLLAYPVYLFVKDSQARQLGISGLGAAEQAAGCAAITENAATGNQQHVAEGTKVTYAQTPPDSGAHYASPAPFTKHFYSVDDRPAVETLVHNLEHGYTVVWYRADAPADQITALQQVSKTFGSETYDPTQKFIAAPWSESDGAGFPDGKNVVLTRWTANPANPSDQAGQKGVQQACVQVSGAAIKDFMAKYPVTNSPEPNGA